MSKTSEFLSKIVQFVRRETPSSVANNPADYADMMRRMSLVGLFDTIEAVAKAGKATVAGIQVLPKPLIRVYLTGIINSCVLVEQALNADGPVAGVAEEPSTASTAETDDGFDEIVKQFSNNPKKGYGSA